MVEIKINVTYCYQCPFCKIVPDPDPTDDFCSDDVAILCTKISNINGETYWASRKSFENRPVTLSERPQNISKIIVPDWCPFKNQ